VNAQGSDADVAQRLAEMDAPGVRLGNDATLVDLLDRVLERGVVVTGDVMLTVAGVDLVYVGLRLILKGVDGTEPTP
jgi:hypothetical protein